MIDDLNVKGKRVLSEKIEKILIIIPVMAVFIFINLIIRASKILSININVYFEFITILNVGQ